MTDIEPPFTQNRLDPADAAPTPCIHHWIIPPARDNHPAQDGWTAGRCRNCGLVRQFDNYGRSSQENERTQTRPGRGQAQAARLRAERARTLYEQGWSETEIAEELRVSANTVRSYLAEAPDHAEDLEASDFPS